MAESIFWLSSSVEEDRPFHLRVLSPRYGTAEQLNNMEIMRGEPGYAPADWTPPEVVCEEPGATTWDLFSSPLASDVFSQRAIDVLRPYLERCFLPLPCSLEGERYYCLHIRDRIDCLDVEHSEFLYFDHGGIMDIKRYVFYREQIRDPMIFAIPEEPVQLFATHSIPQLVQREGLKGFAFTLVDL